MYTSTRLKQLSEILNKPSLAKLTVSDICSLINKTENQFYKLYGDKAGFYLMLVEVALKNSLWLTEEDESIEKIMSHVVLTLREYRHFFTNIAKFIGTQNHEAVKNMIKHEFERYYSYYVLNRIHAVLLENRIKQEALKTYFILSTWLKGGCREEPEIVCSLLEDVFLYLNGKIV